MECLFIEKELDKKKSQKVNVEELVKISLTIFSVASSPQAASYCMYTFLKYLNQAKIDQKQVEEVKCQQKEESK